jgi:hypothetical protein
MRILRQETVPGMDGVGAGDLGRADNPVQFQVALTCGRRTDTHRLVCQLDVEGLAVGLGVHRYRLDVELSASPNDPDGYFAAVCNQYF